MQQNKSEAKDSKTQKVYIPLDLEVKKHSLRTNLADKSWLKKCDINDLFLFNATTQLRGSLVFRPCEKETRENRTGHFTCLCKTMQMVNIKIEANSWQYVPTHLSVIPNTPPIPRLFHHMRLNKHRIPVHPPKTETQTCTWLNILPRLPPRGFLCGDSPKCWALEETTCLPHGHP